MPESNNLSRSVGNKFQWEPDNPHPLAKMKHVLEGTELVWEGKYDEYGNRPGWSG